MHPILTIKEAEQILTAKSKKINTLYLSLDLGLTQSKVKIKKNFIWVNDEQQLPLSALKKIKEGAGYIIVKNELRQISFFSDETKKYYKLIPAKDWPTVALSSTPMHRHTNISPKEDTLTKINEISPLQGKVLDTCCGLGYTAIMSARELKVSSVDTFERDENILRIAEFNPYSQELFKSQAESKIILHREKNIAEEIFKFLSNYFDRIIHDPPTFKYSPELYTVQFYGQLYRVLKKGGILYHYAPHPHKTKGVLLYPKIIKKLKEAGFKNVVYHEFSSGIRMEK